MHTMPNRIMKTPRSAPGMGGSRCRAFVFLFIFAVTGCAQASVWNIDRPVRVVAISDVHGAYDGMLRTLRSASVIDAENAWIAGETHLVITGDMLDRGADSRKVMDLFMALEPQAEEDGGQVHVLLGNHEVMNLVGDLRYVARGEYAAFAADEDAEERARWFEYFRAANAEVADEETLRADFDRKAPPGFFAHRRAFRPDGYYGKWLLQQPLLQVIDGTAYVHGGLSPMVARLGLSGVNDRLRAELRAYTEAVAELNDAGFLSPVENFYYHAALLEPLASEGSLSDKLGDAVNTVIKLSDSDIHSSDGPLWYRGNVGCGPLSEIDKLDAALQAIGARRVVIGHTPTVTRRVLERLDGRVLEIDTGMLTAAYRGSGNALVVNGDSLQVFNESGAESSPVPHPRRVGSRGDSVTADDLAAALATGAITGTIKDPDGRIIVSVATADGSISAVFTENPKDRGFVPELAAYKLDRLLSLDMVPVTVPREIDGDPGSLQFLPQEVRNESQRVEGREGGSAWCPLPDQWSAMYVFDALTYNPGRRPEAMVYDTGDWQLMLVDNEASFANKRGRPAWLKSVDLQLGDAWVRALQSIDDATLEENLADVLDKKRLSALGKRRDELLKEAAP